MLVQELTAEKFVEKGRRAMGRPTPDGEQGVYGISVAAELVGMGVQTLRLYEARGLLEPERTEGGTRRYSANDLERLRRIGDLLDAGLNLAGIGMVLDLEAENTQLRAEKEDQQWLKTAPIPGTRSPKRISSNSNSRSSGSQPTPRRGR
jgi:DNA-binding transcriptional MerR regulator